MMRRLWTQVVVENRLFFRDPVVVAFHMLLPLLLLLLLTRVHANMLMLRWTVGVADQDGSPAARHLVAGLRALPQFRVVEEDVDSLRGEKAAGRVSSILVLPHGLASPAIDGDASIASLLRVVVAGLLREGDGAPPIADAPASGAEPFAGTLLPGVVGMVVASVALFGFGARLAAYRQRGFLRRLAVTPLGVRQFLAAQTIHRIGFMLLQSAVLIAVGRYAVGAAGGIRVADCAIVLVAGALAFLGLGFLIGGRASSGEAAAGWCHLLFFPMLLLSGAFYPVAALPVPLRFTAPVLPMTYLLDGLRRSLEGLGGIGPDVCVLAGWAALLLVVSARTFSPE